MGATAGKMNVMQNIFIRLVSVIGVVLYLILPAFGFGGGQMFSSAPEKLVSIEGMKVLTIPIQMAGSKEIQQIALFSEEYAKTPVAMVNDEPITLQDFATELANMHNSMDESEAPGSRSFVKMLDRLIAVKLVKQEALNIGFDQTPELQNKINEFALETMIKQLLAGQLEGLQVDATAVEELYAQMAIEVKLLTYRLFDKGDAEALLTDIQSGGDFKTLADKLVTAAKAEGGEEPEYKRLQDFVPAVAKAVYAMTQGDVSEVFKAEKGYLLFQLVDRRGYEDAQVRLVAVNQLLQQQSRKKQQEYLKSLEDKYARFDETVEEALDFAKINAESPEVKGTEVFERLSKDKRALVTLTSDQETVVISVAEIAKKLEASMYHGMDRAIDHEQLDLQKGAVIWNAVTAITGRLEAQAQGIDKSETYLAKLQEYKDQLLFDTFVAKAVLPGVKVPEKAVREYYYNHLEDYSSPLMLKMKSLVFSAETSAREAVKKLKDGSDFKWVSANITGLVDPEEKQTLNLGGSLLAATSLPEDLQKQVVGARQNDVFFYAGPGQIYYVLVVEAAFPPKAKTYAEVRQDVGKIIFGQKINEALEDWVAKLKQVYETKVFIVPVKV